MFFKLLKFYQIFHIFGLAEPNLNQSCEAEEAARKMPSPTCSQEIPDFLAGDGFEPLSAADSKPDERTRAAHVMLFARSDEDTRRSCEGIRALVMVAVNQHLL